MLHNCVDQPRCGLPCPQGDFLTLFEAVAARSVAVEGGLRLEAGAQAEASDGRHRETTRTTRGPVNSFAQAQREPPRDNDLPGAKVKVDHKSIGAQCLAEAEVCVLWNKAQVMNSDHAENCMRNESPFADC